MDIGVRERKQNLSAYLERAARGESIRDTDRGVPKAMLGPAPGAARFDEGIANGWVTPPESREPAARIRRARSTARIDETLVEDRGE